MCQKDEFLSWPFNRPYIMLVQCHRKLVGLTRHTSIFLLHVHRYTPILTSIDSICLISSRDHVFPIVNAPFWLRLVLYSRILLRFSILYKVSIAYLLYIHNTCVLDRDIEVFQRFGECRFLDHRNRYVLHLQTP